MQSALTRYAIIVMLVIGFTASVYACGRATDATRGETRLEKLAIGDMERMDFAFRGENASTTAFLDSFGKQVTLADFEGKTVLVNVWATWCSPCIKEMPSLAQLQTARGGENFQVIALNIDELTERDYAKGELAKLSGGVLDFYQTEDLTILQPLGVTVFPTTVIYGADGSEVVRYLGDTEWTSHEAIAFIDEVLKQN